MGVDRGHLPLPCTVELHLVGAAGPAKIGSTSLLAMPQTGTSYSTTPMRRALVRKATQAAAPAVFNDNDNILVRLRRIGIVIRTVRFSVLSLFRASALAEPMCSLPAWPDGESVSLSSVPSLTETVQQRSYQPATADNQSPRYGPVTR